MKVNILGTPYNIRYVKYGEDPYMEKMSFDAYCDGNTYEIVVVNQKTNPAWDGEPEKGIEDYRKKTIRHEIIHAFLNESGLQGNSNVFTLPWAKNEEMVDWIAVQAPKILKAFEQAGVL